MSKLYHIYDLKLLWQQKSSYHTSTFMGKTAFSYTHLMQLITQENYIVTYCETCQQKILYIIYILVEHVAFAVLVATILQD
jgi:hypothetical protein